ncbi:hypothetical protein [Streptomyces sp. NPDC013457]|uniref:hypothetical protein n=1 Tax=Streptomyces sp. NPDC013457 TaxID=3364866 RepID=UPI0036F76A4D
MSLLPLGRDHSLRAEYGPALAVFERAVAISSELGTEEHLTWTKFRLSQERSRSGDHEGAVRDVHAAQRLARDRGLRRMEVGLLPQLAYAHRVAGELDLADEALDRMEAVVHRLPYPEQTSRDIVTAGRMANLITAGAPERARAMLPRAVRGYVARGDTDGITWVAEQRALLIALEGDPVGAATALGMTRAIRGAFDFGDPELRALATQLTQTLGEAAYTEAYGRGAALPRPQALALVTEEGADGA